jgi:Homeodomain-like domain
MSDPLRAIGLTGAEECVYELLIDRPQDLAAALREDPDLRATLEGLERKGLIHGSGERYGAVAPDVALDALLLDHEQELSRAREYVTELIAAREESEPGGVIEVVSGEHAVRQRLAQVQRSAREQIRCLDKPPYVDRIGTSATDLQLLANGVACRTLYERTSVDQPDALSGIEELILAGQQSRVLPELPMKLYLVDARFAVVPLHRRMPVVDAAVFIRPGPLLDTFDILFESLWQRALPIGHAAVPSEPDQRLITLLLSGLTDRAIARQLGIGYRTVQRRVAALLADLGVHTRFQAGVRVALREPRRR